MSEARTALCYGEALWDCLPRGLFLGGAPLNVAFHLHQLGTDALPVSAVGRDFLGDELLRRLRRLGLDTRFVPQVADRPTGVVQVELDAEGHPSYDIVEGVAWDAIPGSAELAEAAERADAVVFGTLAQRSAANRELLDSLLERCPGQALLDVNLRPPFDGHDLVWRLARHAHVIKLNDHELRELCDDGEAPLEDLARLLRDRSGCHTVCVTAGADGAGLLVDGAWHWCPGRAVTVRDTVGAGDSFTAALLDGLLRDAARDRVLERACRLAEFVAGSDGATPSHEAAPAEARTL